MSDKDNQAKFEVRRWVFTLNNPSMTAQELGEELCKRYKVRYYVAGHEVAPTTGTKHLQGYIEYENACTLEQNTKRIVGAHFEPAKGSNAQCRDYCTKGGSYYEVGKLNTRVQGGDYAYEVVRLIVEKRLNPARVAVDYPQHSAYVVNHFSQLLALYREVMMLDRMSPND